MWDERRRASVGTARSKEEHDAQSYRYGGLAASVILIVFGAGAVYTGIDGRDRVQGDLAREKIVGTPDSAIPGQLVDTGSEAQAFAATIRRHTLESTGGKTYAERRSSS